MFLSLLIATVLFYVLAVLQNSFFAHYGFFGACPNLVFALLFLFVFFEKKSGPKVVYLSLLAGFLLDAVSLSPFGLSMVLLLLVSLLLKKLQTSLKDTGETHLVYFIAVFAVCYIIYSVLLQAYLKVAMGVSLELGWDFLASLAYNAFFSAIGFYIFKKLAKNRLWQKFIT